MVDTVLTVALTNDKGFPQSVPFLLDGIFDDAHHHLLYRFAGQTTFELITWYESIASESVVAVKISRSAVTDYNNFPYTCELRNVPF